MKQYPLLISSIIVATLIGATSVSAQLQGNPTAGTGASSANTNAATTGSIYNPVSSSDTKKTFSGTSFSSVGGAIAGCANIGGLLVGGVTSLFSKASSTASDPNAVATTDGNSTKELKRANRTTECLNGVAYAISKNLLQQVSNKTLNWINKGLGGNPLYVQDVASNLQTIRDEQLGRYLDTVATSNPIFGNAIRSAVTKQVTGISDGYIGVAMDTPEAKEYQAFQQDFTSGGWGSLLNMRNNPLGAIFSSTDKISNQIATKQEERVNEIQRNNGFLDMKTCVEYAPTLSLEEENRMRVRFGYAANTTAKTPECLRYKTVTPGALISQQASSILNSPTRQLEMADSINEVLGAFFDQLLNNLYQRGLAGLQTRGGSGSSMTYGSNVVLGTNGLPINTTANTFGYNTIGSGYDVQDFDISRPQQLYDIIQAQYDFLNRASDSQVAMESIVPTLGALDYCIPGPNPTWRDGLGENYQTFMGSLETPTKGRSTLANILSTIPILGGLFGTDDKEIQYALAGNPVLFDKTTDSSVTISPWSYLIYTKDYDRGVKNTNGDWIRNFVNEGYKRLVGHYERNFTEQAIISLFNPTNDPYAQGMIKSSLTETAKLVSYNNNLAPLSEVYTSAISDSGDAVAELEDIRAEANAIVKVAKARYIRERAALGNPVDMTCINNAYIINENPITGVARQESSTSNPMIQQSRDANAYFYTTL